MKNLSSKRMALRIRLAELEGMDKDNLPRVARVEVETKNKRYMELKVLE